MSQAYTKVKKNKYGFYQLHPLPPAHKVEEFYRQHYVAQAGRAAKLKNDANRKLVKGLEGFVQTVSEPKRQKLNTAWIEETIYRPIADALRQLKASKRVLEVGCGNGGLLMHLKKKGFQVSGIEPNREWSQKARRRGLPVATITFEDYLQHKHPTFDVAVFSNVLEHVMDPVQCLKDCQKLLRKNGYLVVRVPNDFTAVQDAALRAIRPPFPWWICAPDHISYFNLPTLQKFLQAHGFRVKFQTVDFPMELLLMMGVDYVNNPSLGKVAHLMRCQMEMSLPRELRQKLLQAFASAGLGRNVTVIAQKVR